MRIVIDTNILVRATPRADGPARELLNEIRSGPHLLVLSSFILGEVSRVLNYPRLQALWPLDQGEIDGFVEKLGEIADLVELPVREPETNISQDPDDNPIIQTAIDGQADVLCTLDHHFRHPDARAYCAKHSIQIMGDVDLLRRLRKKGQSR